jgi:hypothetical protein
VEVEDKFCPFFKFVLQWVESFYDQFLPTSISWKASLLEAKSPWAIKFQATW